MIRTFSHKSLKRFFETGNPKGLRAEHIERLKDILFRLDNAEEVKDMDAPGLKLHKLKGEYKNCWSVWVSGNWRIIFRFDDKDVFDVDYLDYH